MTLKRYIGLAAALGLMAMIPSGVRAQAAVKGGSVRGDLGFVLVTKGPITVLGKHGVEFSAEPQVQRVQRGGPADGKLRDGDVLVAVDGQLITRRAGGQRMMSVRAGVPVRLTIRRDGRTMDVTVIPVAQTGMPEELVAPEPPDIPDPSDLPAPPPPPASTRTGTLGVSISCWCSVSLDSDGFETWQFRQPPEVIGKVAGGAAKAGVQEGDHILRVDGLLLTTPDGGRRFGHIAPGDRVRLTLERGKSTVDVTVVAGSRKTK